MLYATPFYADSFYGSDELDLPPGGPYRLSGYQNVIDSLILYWKLYPCTDVLGQYAWMVELDLDPGFASANYRKYMSTDQAVRFSSSLVDGNTYSVDINSVTVSVPFRKTHAITLSDIALAVAARPGVLSSFVQDGMVVVQSPHFEPVFPGMVVAGSLVAVANSAVTGGASQAATTISDAWEFVSGALHKGMVVPSPKRKQGSTQTMYWRVTGERGNVLTATRNGICTIASAVNEVVRDAVLGSFSDVIYRKDSGSNIFKLHDAFGSVIDTHHVANVLANNDISTSLVRDLTLEDSFGSMVDIRKPQLMNVLDFREIIKNFFVEARNSSATLAIRNMVRAALCYNPSVTRVIDELDWFVEDASTPPVVPAYVEDVANAVSAPTCWSMQEIGNGIIVRVVNNMGAAVSREFLESILRKLAPAHTSLFLSGI